MAYSDFTSLDGRARIVRPAIPVGNFSLLSGHHYNPDQPRVPAGQSGGGQWTSEDHSSHQNTDPRSDEGRVISDAIPDAAWIPWARYAGGGIRGRSGGFYYNFAVEPTFGQLARLAVAQG